MRGRSWRQRLLGSGSKEREFQLPAALWECWVDSGLRRWEVWVVQQPPVSVCGTSSSAGSHV